MFHDLHCGIHLSLFSWKADHHMTDLPLDGTEARPGDIAVIGIACRFPGAPDPETYWRNLTAGVESVQVLPRTSEGADDGRVRAGAVLDGIEDFDAGFFGYSTREAELLDPQHRVFLECAWEAIEDAGYHPAALHGPVGVYGGTGLSTYLVHHVHPQRGSRSDSNFIDSMSDLQMAVAADRDYLASRVSYKLDLTGPALAVQAACATSLYAVHLACQALLNGECDTALAGAASIPVPQIEEYAFEPGMVFSPDGHCRAFDERAEGTVFGSGAGVVLLKPLQDALDDGDSVYAVIKGSAINNDGQRKVGYTATSVSGQVRVIRDALAVADVDPATIGYVEAHGTGTTIGDPIEVAALTEAFGTDPRRHWCGLGTAKTNIGHLGWAAGMAGLIKTVLALRHRTIPPSLHFRRPNPRIDFEHSPFHVVTALMDWPTLGDSPRRAGVSAFGLGGANAHVVLEEAPQPVLVERDTAGSRARLLPISARTPNALAALAGRYAAFLAESPHKDLTDVAATASLGRTHHPCRAAIVAGTAAEAAAKLAAVAHGSHEPAASRKASSSFTTAALFSGQGGEYLGMGRQLYRTEPVFKAALDACDAVLRDYLGAPVSQFLYETDDVAAIPLIAHAQPVLFAVQTALFRLWESWGIRPTVMMGHSLGEYAAAWAAGVFSLEDGLRLVAERGRLLQSLPDNGSMAAVLAAEPVVLELLGTRSEVAVAAVNGSANTVISGHSEAMAAACARLRATGLEVKELRISRAGHSALMDPVLDDFEKVVRTIGLKRPQHTLISNLTGMVIGAEAADPLYWRRHLREPVRFLDGLNTLTELGVDAAVEMGAAPVLTGIAASALPDVPVLWVPSLRPGQEDRAQVLSSLGALYEHGAPVDWEAVHREPFRRQHLPTYPFQRERHWIEAPTSAAVRRDDAASAAPGWADWIHDVEWREAVVSPAANTPADGVWLVCGGGAELDRGLADHLAARGGRVVRATHGARFQHHSDECFTLDFGSRGDVVRLLDRLDAPVRGVVDLLALEPAAAGDGSEAWSGSGLDLAGAGTLHLIQTLTERGSLPPRLWIVSRRAQAAGADVTAQGLWHAALWGMGRVAAIEHPELHCTRVDLDLPGDSDGDAASLAAELVADRYETEVVHRGGQRLVPRLVGRPEAASRPAHGISPEGTYLVTGGLRGVGLLAAERLAEAGAGRLLLLGRSEPDAASRVVLDRLRARGVEVVTARTDVSDLARLREVLAETDLRERPLRGIVHAAGVLDDGMLSQLTWDRFRRVLLPKAQGAWHLHRVTQEREDQLDLFVLFSSTTGLIGNSGQANHSAANAVLDALAHHRRAAGLPATTVNWGAWSDTGFLANRPETLEHLARIGMSGIDRRSGEALIDRAVRTDAVRLVVAPVNWPVFLEHHHLEETGFFATLTGPAPTRQPEENLGRRLGRSTPEERADLLRAEVTRQLERVLGRPTDMANPEAQDEPTLIELGMDSLSAIQLRNGLQRQLGVPLPANLCYAHPTPSRLVAHLADLSYVTVEGLAAPASEPAGTTGTEQALPSFQQRRWRSLVVDVEYGHRIVPIFIPAALDPVRLRESLVRIVARHDALRAVHPNPGEIRTIDAESAVPHIDDLVVAADPADSPREAIAAEMRRLWAARPDVGKSVSWTVSALATSDDEFALLLSLQHLDFDGTSISVFLDEFAEEYTSTTADRARPAGPSPSYRSYARWQQERHLQREAEANAYLRGLYGQVTAPTLLPGRTTLETTETRPSSRYTPDPSECLTTAELAEAARRIGTSPFGLVAAAYGRAVAERFELGEISITSVFSGRTEERFERVVGPMTSHWPLPVPIGPRALADAARAVGRTTAQLADLAAFCPVDSIIRATPAFSGMPHDTYFSDVALNFTSYQRHGTTALTPEVIEILGPVNHPLLDPVDFGGLAFPSGLHLIFDVSGERATPSLWFHTDRFSPDVAAKVVDTMTDFLMQSKKSGE
ncbi:SDR family NAD(P)-dependent oxidoreductase [Streptomyces sp. NPDC048409]|uniref:SDR family NAD(P)-dependent oxidoreductase n=1 Tax=Streptomyces sp. NPDC048409 TaxID=3154723 RepID=UPI00344A7BCA